MTPAAFHHGQAQQRYDQSAVVLAEAYPRKAERFVRKPPVPPELPTAAWINKPKEVAAAHQIRTGAVSPDLAGSASANPAADDLHGRVSGDMPA